MTAGIAYREPGLAPLATAPLKEASIRNLKIAGGLSVAFCFVFLGLFKIAGTLAIHKPQEKEFHMRDFVLGPPISLTDQPAQPKPVFEKPVSMPKLGNPVPVPERDAVLDATPTKGERDALLASQMVENGSGSVGAIAPPVDPTIPRPDTFIVIDTPPIPLETPRPEYPAIAKAVGISGTVYVQILLDLDGSVMRTLVAKSSHNDALDAAAVEGAKKFKFTPAKQRDKPVRVWVSMPIIFRLDN